MRLPVLYPHPFPRLHMILGVSILPRIIEGRKKTNLHTVHTNDEISKLNPILINGLIYSVLYVKFYFRLIIVY